MIFQVKSTSNVSYVLFHCCSDLEVANYKSGWITSCRRRLLHQLGWLNNYEQVLFRDIQHIQSCRISEPSAVYAQTVWQNWKSFGEQMTRVMFFFILSYTSILSNRFVSYCLPQKSRDKRPSKLRRLLALEHIRPLLNPYWSLFHLIVL